MKHACTCSTFHFNSSTLFAYKVICHVLSSADIFFKISLLLLFFLKKYFGNIIRVSSILDPDHADVLSGLIWFQIVCKSYQQTTLVGKEFKTTFQEN